MAGSLSWVHYDSSGDLHAAALAANAIARTGSAWPSGPEGDRLFRAWLAGVLGTIANLGPTRTHPLSIADLPGGEGASIPVGGAYVVKPSPSSVPVELDWQQQLVYALASLAWVGMGKQGGKPTDLELATDVKVLTKDGEPPTSSPASSPAKLPPVFNVPGLGDVPILTAGVDTGIIPAIPIVTGLVIVACVAIVAGAVAWITSQVSEVTAVGLQQQGKTTLAVKAITTSAELIDAHQEREAKAGASLAWDPQELELLRTLRETIKQTAGWEAPPLRSVPDVRGASSSIGAGLGLGQVIFWALLGYAALEYTRKRAA